MIVKNQPNFKSFEEKVKWLVDNEEELIIAAKSTIKYADAIVCAPEVDYMNFSYKDTNSNNYTYKASQDTDTELKRTVLINTTKIFDSHEDVHFDGLWNKSVKENKNIKFLQEHQMKFDKVIAQKEDLKAYVKEFSWKDLGYDFEGKTEALTFDATIKSDVNNFMFNQYKNNNVDNHSVGMQYVKIKLAINSDDPDYAAYKDTWDKYYPEIANKADVDRSGIFWAVLEAKIIEGSAVLIGSNQFTPTLNQSKNKKEDENEIDELKAYKKFLNLE